MRWVVVACCLAACTNAGALNIDLKLPEGDLRPLGASTVTLVASGEDLPIVTSTSPLIDGAFEPGKLPPAHKVQLSVQLRDAATRLVGLGQAPDRIDLVEGESASVTVPVRKPFVYVSTGAGLMAFDSTVDPRDAKYQTKLSIAADHAIALDGARLVVAATGQLHIFDTATNQETAAVDIGSTTPVHDLVRIPDENRVVVAHDEGISIVDLAGAAPTVIPVGRVDRLTVGTQGGHKVVYGLISRVAPPESPLAMCTGSSSFVTIELDAPGPATPVALAHATSSLAATGDALYATEPCNNAVAQVAADGTSTMLADLPNAAALRIGGGRIVAVGTKPSTPACGNTMGLTPCSASTMMACPEAGTNRLSYVTNGARVVLMTMTVATGEMQTFVLPEQREAAIDTGDVARQHAQDLHPLGAVPIDVALLDGGQFVSIIRSNVHYLESTSDGIQYILPCLLMKTKDWLLFDLASASVAGRVRSRCDLTYRMNAYFNMWQCDDPNESERSTQGTYDPIAVSALFEAP